MIAAIALLAAALIWAVHELREKILELRRVKAENVALQVELMRFSPSHPMCRCSLLPVQPAVNATLAAYGIPHKVLEGGVCEISISSLSYNASESWKWRARHDFDVVEDPTRPGSIFVTEKIR